jgi:DNA repair protein RadC
MGLGFSAMDPVPGRKIGPAVRLAQMALGSAAESHHFRIVRVGRAMRRAEGRKGLSEVGLQPGLQIELPRGSLSAPLPPIYPPEEAPPGHLGHRERMRQKLLTAGPDALLDHELMEMVLFLALPRQDTKPVARALLARFGSFANAIAAPVAELRRVEGIKDAGAAALKTVQAAALRLVRAELVEQPLLNSWDRLIGYLRASMARARVEEVHVLFLDTRNRLLADEVQGRGTVNHTPVYPREVVRRALELQATALILVHNHPSGDPTPSRADIEMTAEIKTAAEVFGIVLHDHLIIGNGRQTSFKREGLL